MLHRALLAVVAAFGLSSCVTAEEPSGEAGTAAGPDPRIGETVERICFPRNINGWRTIKGDKDAIILTEGVRDEYRVGYAGPCRSSDFRSAITIGIAGRPAGGCLRRGDYLLVEGPGDFVNRCFITDIQRWNKDAVDDAAGTADDDAETMTEE